MDYKNLEAWKTAKTLCVDIYRETKDCKDYGYRDQLTRSALSVPSNIAEGTARVSDRETLQFLSIARGSAAELETQVLIGGEIGYVNEKRVEEWLQALARIQKLLFGLIKRYRTNLEK
ncbi:MAG: four helix bundle protein [Xanthomonadales bacterium]|nr:four helix bundle protein [Xanthomonadales bacterium]